MTEFKFNTFKEKTDGGMTYYTTAAVDGFQPFIYVATSNGNGTMKVDGEYLTATAGNDETISVRLFFTRDFNVEPSNVTKAEFLFVGDEESIFAEDNEGGFPDPVLIGTNPKSASLDVGPHKRIRTITLNVSGGKTLKYSSINLSKEEPPQEDEVE